VLGVELSHDGQCLPQLLGGRLVPAYLVLDVGQVGQPGGLRDPIPGLLRQRDRPGVVVDCPLVLSLMERDRAEGGEGTGLAREVIELLVGGESLLELCGRTLVLANSEVRPAQVAVQVRHLCQVTGLRSNRRGIRAEDVKAEIDRLNSLDMERPVSPLTADEQTRLRHPDTDPLTAGMIGNRFFLTDDSEAVNGVVTRLAFGWRPDIQHLWRHPDHSPQPMNDDAWAVLYGTPTDRLCDACRTGDHDDCVNRRTVRS
jgi:hypothetical protein